MDPPEEKSGFSKEDKCGFSEMEIFIEFKRRVSDDPFRDKPLPKGAFVHNTGSSKGTLGQMGSYAAAVLGVQFRIHLYSILICGKYARLVRWERDRAVVTERFDYQNSKNPLTEFIWRYSQLDLTQRGHDPTVTEWDESDPRNQWLQTAKEEMKGQNNLHLRFRQMVINDRDDPMIEKNFLFSYPQNFTSRSPFGRGTRGMTGCDVDLEGCRNRMVYIKDYWRPEGGEKEGDIYRTLEEKNVPNIPRFYCGNDVCHEVPRNNDSEEVGDDSEEVGSDSQPVNDESQQVNDESQQVNDDSQQVPDGQEGPEEVSKIRTLEWALVVPNTHAVIHYRMALDRVGRKLTEFRSARELVTAIADAMQGSSVLAHFYFAFICLAL